MIHLGDITKLNGAEIPVVDCITGGSPCQDLSIAGMRAGLDGERSGLFMDQIRIVKEMREHDRATGRTGKSIRPRYMVWENVPGAFSSNGGEDFRIVLEETARISDSSTTIPRPSGGWSNAGVILGDDWSIAWRVHDAQFWGVPQRRRRISLVADFGGQSAPEILFERKSVSGDIEKSRETREEVAGSITEGTGEAISFQERSGKPGGVKESLSKENTQEHCQHSITNTSIENNNETCYCLQGNGIDRADTAGCNGKGWREDQSYTLNTIDRPAVYVYNGENITSPTNKAQPKEGDPCHTLGQDSRNYVVFEPRSQDGVPRVGNQNISPTLNTGGWTTTTMYLTARHSHIMLMTQ